MSTTEEPKAKRKPVVGPVGDGDEFPEAETDLLRDTADNIEEMDAADVAQTRDWFLSGKEVGRAPHFPVRFDVRHTSDPEWHTFVCRVLDPGEIDSLREQCMKEEATNRRERRSMRGLMKSFDNRRYNALLVFTAMVDPDPQEMIRQLQEQGKTWAVDGADLILRRFSFKPLLVEQIAGQVLRASGGDEDDVKGGRDLVERAAGN
jgi:hypothetical protein